MNVNLDTRASIEYPVATQEAVFGTSTYTWAVLATVWIELLDDMPSKSEEAKSGIVIATRRARVRFRYRTDVTSAMQFRITGPVERILKITSPPAEVGGRGMYCEVTTAEHSS